MEKRIFILGEYVHVCVYIGMLVCLKECVLESRL